MGLAAIIVNVQQSTPIHSSFSTVNDGQRIPYFEAAFRSCVQYPPLKMKSLRNIRTKKLAIVAKSTSSNTIRTIQVNRQQSSATPFPYLLFGVVGLVGITLAAAALKRKTFHGFEVLGGMSMGAFCVFKEGMSENSMRRPCLLWCPFGHPHVHNPIISITNPSSIALNIHCFHLCIINFCQSFCSPFDWSLAALSAKINQRLLKAERPSHHNNCKRISIFFSSVY